jgi:hypothetical protein
LTGGSAFVDTVNRGRLASVTRAGLLDHTGSVAGCTSTGVLTHIGGYGAGSRR